MFTLNEYKEHGSLKKITAPIRLGSQGIDFIPGLGIDEASAATLAGVAALIDTGALVAKRDFVGAGEELVAGVADSLLAAVPFIEYGRLVGFDVRGLGRQLSSKFYCKAMGAESRIFSKEETPATQSASEGNPKSTNNNAAPPLTASP